MYPVYLIVWWRREICPHGLHPCWFVPPENNKKKQTLTPERRKGGGKPKIFMYILNRVRLSFVKRMRKECEVSISPKKEEPGFKRKVRIGRVCAGKE